MSKRQSGRTYRMMAEARRLRDAGRAVYVVFATKKHADMHDTPENAGVSLESIGTYEEGPETGPEGRACADLAALRAGCILEEVGDPRDPTKPPGWYVPLPGGEVGWWAKEGA